MNSTSTLAPHAPGWFGKVPMLGDFAQRRLPPAFVATCDPWLSQCMQASRLSLGEAWLDRYLTAPVWQFAWAPGIVDEQWWLGVLMPSVDAVGRYFPLVIASAAESIPVTAESLGQLGRWYDHVGRSALDVLRPNMTVDHLESGLLAAQALYPAPDAGDPQTVAARDVAGEWFIAAAARGWPGNAGTAALAAVASCLAGHTLWWPRCDADNHDADVCVRRGLPAPGQFVAPSRPVRHGP